MQPSNHLGSLRRGSLRRAGLVHLLALRTIQRSETEHTTHDQGKPQIQCACTDVKSYLECRGRANALGKLAHGADEHRDAPLNRAVVLLKANPQAVLKPVEVQCHPR